MRKLKHGEANCCAQGHTVAEPEIESKQFGYRVHAVNQYYILSMSYRRAHNKGMQPNLRKYPQKS